MKLTKKMPAIAMGAWAWGNDGTFGDHYEASDLTCYKQEFPFLLGGG